VGQMGYWNDILYINSLRFLLLESLVSLHNDNQYRSIDDDHLPRVQHQRLYDWRLTLVFQSCVKQIHFQKGTKKKNHFFSFLNISLDTISHHRRVRCVLVAVLSHYLS
jgi:EAL domain-containing protein (putative c-di-GMP-specific phosphodiesterase class I)